MAFDPIRIENEEELVSSLNRIQDNLVAEFSRQSLFTFEAAVLVQDVVLTTADADVPHGLGQLVRGYIITKRSADATVFDGAVAATDPQKFISLTASATVTVDILFF